MFWRYTLFEAKLLIKNRKIWFITAFLLLFYLLFFMYNQQEQPPSLADQKRQDVGMVYAAFDHLDLLRHDLPEVAEVYDYVTQISSLVGMQVWNIGRGSDSEQYIEDGLKANELRLKVHELGNEGIPEHLIVPREEILKENALLHYIRDNELPIESDSFATNHFITKALNAMTGILFLVVFLIAGNELLVFEQRHRTVMKGFPLSFMKRIISKVLTYFVFLYSLLLVGFYIGTIYADKKLNAGEFEFPVLIYKDGGFIAVSTGEYLLNVFLGLALVAIVILLLSILLNMLFKNAFANVLIGIGIFLLPDLMMAAGINATFLDPIKSIDIANVLSGDLAVQLGNDAIDYGYAMMSLGIIAVLLVGVIFAINKFQYQRTPKHSPLEKAF
ncbi:ABC transporter permease subunit [Ornithinibacillus halophilus]|uniref:ABC-2 type transport system permease protein n=1 Tax=Ornithinibacillus halophilus TaxID=930117 RepID=A0A1M5FT58_9BACI|nr:ABC transporter permease subunit [Ornithinibacillus halophilus]SHF94683.1 hypothetical protein SAMN05216225_101013 [Ornithinibacillus halophilus]